uniref:RNA polymerase subunit H/Rpb5 C-terminal domain-containing protein n=1 Tax=Chromera velia CCMP2878 TaxID=1169474 RepID=A0A0G4I3B5_9ALVE|eukprot:Cvel_10624.t1-p1 / transcript=Cvel_10624.t1 / gene=Cvel_10624 / organism=Chromera_velia_CCMP2878 / gene_product=DNA-directed RNA polymerases I, II, and III subunit, putative / transcript_product=DNA-directed RNA polymerases I, II, and III subunit, putative / location=Cvel_scaffold645:15395-19047(+) / protein_length=217 / sequence_SO=supercontig / SO=protein_coding / is_pseudo=false
MAAAGVGGSEQDQVLLGKLTRARRTVYQMLKDRGYKVPESCLEETRETVEQEFRQNEEKLEKMIILVSRPSDSEDKLLVFFAESSKKVGVLPIRKLTDQMTENNINKAILVVTHPLTPFAKEAINEMKPKHNIETFQMSELMVNITHHELVPKHIPLSKEDKERLLEKYKVKEFQLPRMLHTDPIARYFNLEKGSVVKIIRPSETAGRYVTYRLISS